jgi:aspartate/methionine/tyrosine aminotransferase
MRRVLHEMGEPYSHEVELISMNSVSKGLLGECGLRGGYMETHNLSNRAEQILYKLKSIELCSNTPGQLAVNLMVDPPHIGRESTECIDQYNMEKTIVMNGLKERASLLTNTFNDMKQITCTEIEGAMYGFPRVHFSEKFISEAKKQGKQPDFIYCMEMVNKTGIMTVPGSGFGQAKGTYHFRITNLVNPTSHMEAVLQNLKKFNDEFHATH